jgi:tRNA U34 5-carboxymethylaminomethyl modifying GTPase MnmE/TrmE
LPARSSQVGANRWCESPALGSISANPANSSTDCTLVASRAKFLASDQKQLTVALIGQYNAGKSMLIKALTGRSDIKIDSDICTDQIKAYDWHGIELIDTPGIHAGRSDHDSITYEAIDRADLLMFVITNELFNNCIGTHFRRLAFDRQKGQELMLVVNKMSQDPGGAAQKLKDITRVIEPKSAQDLYVTFTDAESYLDAQTADPDDKRELIELSGMESLVGNMNRFVTDRGLLARLTTPVFEIRRIADQIVNYFAVDQVEERMALELLYRKREILVLSRSRLEAALRSEMARTAVAVNVLGDRLAEAIRPGVSETELNANAERVRQQVEAACRDTAGRIELLVSKEVDALAPGLTQTVKTLFAVG